MKLFQVIWYPDTVSRNKKFHHDTEINILTSIELDGTDYLLCLRYICWIIDYTNMHLKSRWYE